MAGQGFEATVIAEEGGELAVEDFFAEGPRWIRVWIWQQFDGADGVAVVVGCPSQIGLIAQHPVFSAVIEAVDVFADVAMEIFLGRKNGRLE